LVLTIRGRLSELITIVLPKRILAYLGSFCVKIA
jgi:hypothetical protein